nr:putative ribonuclease H-like domain-containing protein [Tanacetum cinerariifolium]
FINNVNARVKSKSVKKTVKRKVWKPTVKVFTNIGYIWRPTGRTFTIVGNAYPLTRINTTIEVPLRKPISLESNPPKPVVTLVYSRKPKEYRNNISVSKSKINKSLSANKKEPNKSWGSTLSNVPSSSIDECRLSKLFSDNGSEFINQTLREYYERVCISHETYVARSPQQNGVVERRNRMLIEAAYTMLIYARAPIFLWAEAVATTCFLPKYLRPTLHKMTPATISSGLMPKPTSSTPFVPPSRTDWDMLFQPLFDELLTPSPSVDHPAPKVIAPIAEVVAPKPAASTGSPSSTTVDQDAPSPSNS